ncbi:MAG TPA: hypothetical protein VF986_02830 [Actinomycetota bacterium]
MIKDAIRKPFRENLDPLRAIKASTQRDACPQHFGDNLGEVIGTSLGVRIVGDQLELVWLTHGSSDLFDVAGHPG